MKKFFIPNRLWRWKRQSVPKRFCIKFRRRGITQKKAYNNALKAFSNIRSCKFKVNWTTTTRSQCICLRAFKILAWLSICNRQQR
jgi:hypothetical protein